MTCLNTPYRAAEALAPITKAIAWVPVNKLHSITR